MVWISHLMNQGLNGLDLAHAFLQRDPVIHRVEIALRTGIDLLESNRDRAGTLQGFEEHFVLLHIASELIHADGGERAAVGLRDIKNIYHLKGRHHDLLHLRCLRAIRIQPGLTGGGVDDSDLHLFLIGRRRQDPDSLCTLQYLSAEVLLPGSVSSHVG